MNHTLSLHDALPIYIHSGNLGASGATLPEAVLKVSKRQ